MKGLAILFATLGLCIKYANAAVARDLIHTTSVGATTNPIPIEKIKTLILDNNERIENEIFLNADLAPRGKSLVLSETEASMFKKVIRCMHRAMPLLSWPNQRELHVNSAFRECVQLAQVRGWEMFARMKKTYIGLFTATGWPATELQDGGTQYPQAPPRAWIQHPRTGT